MDNELLTYLLGLSPKEQLETIDQILLTIALIFEGRRLLADDLSLRLRQYLSSKPEAN